MLRRRLDPQLARSTGAARSDDPSSFVAQLAAVRSLAEEVALTGDLDDQLETLARSALELTGFGCGQVVVREDRGWVGYGGAQCDDASSCPVCRTDEAFLSVDDRTVVLDRSTELGAALLADAPPEMQQVLVSPVTVGPERRVLLVLRSDDPNIEVDELVGELVGVLAARSAVAVEHNLTLATEGRLRAKLARDRALTADLVQVLTHDLRSPMSTVVSAIMSLVERADAIAPALRDRLLLTAVEQAQRALRLADDVATSITTYDGELPVTRQRVDLLVLVADERAKIAATAPTQDVVVDAPRHATAAADHERTGQVLQNLVDNALKHGDPRAPIRLTVRTDPAVVQIDVTNGGTPVPVAERERLFTRYARGADAVDRPGMGLGLHVARRLARVMGGDVQLVASTPAGTTFRLTLPAAAPDG